MIFGNINQLETYGFLGEDILACFTYAKTHVLKERKPGTYPIDGERFYVNIAEYTTAPEEEKFWEAHRKYLDIHLLLKGTERIDLGFIKDMEQKEYVPGEDFLPLEGEAAARITLGEGDFLVCFPEDGHRTGVAARKPQNIKKAIFKVQRRTDRVADEGYAP